MATKKILTIDFNIIMYPCIQLYTNSNNDNEYINWEILQKQLNINNFLGYDANTLELLAILIHNAYKNNIPIVALKNQSELITILNDDNENNKDVNYDITNIDFFSDICDNENDIVNCDMFDKFYDHTWIHYLQIKNKTNNLTWIKAPNSPLPQLSTTIFKEILPLSTLKSIDISTYDKIYLSLSPNIIPYNFYHLFKILKICGEVL